MIYDISEQYTDDFVTYFFLNNPSDLIYDKWYPLYRRTTIFCFTFVLVIVNSIISD